MRTGDQRRRLLSDARLYVIAPAHLRAGRLADLIPLLTQAGAGIFQLRDRSLNADDLLSEAIACAQAARLAGALLIINDDQQLAAACGGDGVHLGQLDGAIGAARVRLGPDLIIGRTTIGGLLLAAAADEGADYASVSPIWATPTKPNRAPVGLRVVAAAACDARLPWFALGGIDGARARRVAAIGATRIAVVREITDSADPALAVRMLIDALDTTPRVLTVAGSDSGGGAGIQADIKAIVGAGGYPMTAITALTAQSTLGVTGIVVTPADFVVEQMRAAIDDLGVDAIKTGMLASRSTIEAIAEQLTKLDPTMEIPIVVDPVMRAESGAALIDAGAEQALRDRLLPLARVTTPNLFEAQALAEDTTTDARLLALTINARAGCAVIVTGGHGPTSADVLCEDGVITLIEGERLSVHTTHGAGCTYASTLATLLGGGSTLLDAAREAKRIATAAVRGGRTYGAGAGPVDVSRARDD